MTKTYTVTNVRESYSGDIQGTVRQDSVRKVLQDYPDCVTVWQTGFHPPRFEINHAHESNQLESAKEDGGQPGIKFNAGDLSTELERYDYKCTTKKDYDGKQIVTCRGTMRTYEVHVDTTFVEFEFPSED